MGENGGIAGAAGTGTAGSQGFAGAGGAGPACEGHDINVPVATLTGTVTAAGARLSATNQVGFVFRSTVGDAQIVVDGATAYTARLVPGTYDLYYRAGGGAPATSGVPLNGFAKIREGLAISRGSSSLDIDIPVADVTVSFTVGGAAVSTEGNAASIYFRNTSRGDDVAYLGTINKTNIRLVPGTYDVEYSLSSLSATLPANARARIRTGVVIPKGSSSLDLDIPVATITGSFTVNGAAIGSTSYDQHIVLSDAAMRDGVTLGYLGPDPYSARVVPGTYDVYYQGDAASSTVPLNAHARIRTGVVIPAGSFSLDVDVPVATVTGSFTVNGAPAPSPNQFSRVFARNTATHDAAFLGYVGQTTYAARLVPGTYDVYYSGGTSADAPLPTNTGRIRTGVVVPAGNSSLDIDIPFATVTGSFTVNGVALPSTINEGRIGVRNLTDDGLNVFTELGYIGQTTYSARLVPGSYDLVYVPPTTGSTLPLNSGTIRAGVAIPAGSSSLNVDLPAVTIAGLLTVDGAAVPSTSEYGYIYLEDRGTGTQVRLASTAESSYTARVIPGSYDAYYRHFTTGSIANLNAGLRCLSAP